MQFVFQDNGIGWTMGMLFETGVEGIAHPDGKDRMEGACGLIVVGSEFELINNFLSEGWFEPLTGWVFWNAIQQA